MLEFATNLPQLHKDFRGPLLQSQLPFAVASAMTTSAKEGRDSVRKEAEQAFKLTRRWVLLGITSSYVSKKDWPDLEGRIVAGYHERQGVTDSWLTLHATGGVKRPHGGRHLAIPTEHVRRTKGGAVTKAQRPRAALKRRGVFATPTTIARRATRSKPAAVLYLLVPRARIRPTFDFEGASRAGFENYRSHFFRSMDRALRSAKPGKAKPIAPRALAKMRSALS